MQESNIKDLDKVKIIIRWEIIQNLQVKTLKNDQKRYMWDLLESQSINSYYSIVVLIKTSSILALDQVGNFLQANLIAY